METNKESPRGRPDDWLPCVDGSRDIGKPEKEIPSQEERPPFELACSISHTKSISYSTSSMSPLAAYSEGAASSSATGMAHPPDAQSSSTMDEDPSKKKKTTKRRKVNHACLYCRRSHMTCDEGRPCQRW